MSNLDNKVVVLPESDEMMSRLINVFDDPHPIQDLYPRICRMAGTEKVALGVVLGLALAIHDYAEGMPSVVGNSVMHFVPSYLEALIDDEDVRRTAIDHFNAAAA